MNRFRLLNLTGLILPALLLAGCMSSGSTASWNNGSRTHGKSTMAGWGGYEPGDRNGQAAPEKKSDDAMTAGVCYVKAPHLPGAPETKQVLKRPERRVTDSNEVIPAEYVTVDVYPDGQEGFAWLPAVCQEGIDRHLIMKVQEALKTAGYDVGAIDGVEGPATRAGLEYFKRDQGLYGDGYTHETLEALGIDPKTGGPAFASL